MRVLTIILVALLSGCAGSTPLSASDWALEGAWATTRYADYRQTLDIKNHPQLHETNPILGQHPSDSAVRNEALAEAAAHVAITRALPPGWRLAWQGMTISWELKLIGNNRSLGLRVNY